MFPGVAHGWGMWVGCEREGKGGGSVGLGDGEVEIFLVSVVPYPAQAHRWRISKCYFGKLPFTVQLE